MSQKNNKSRNSASTKTNGSQPKKQAAPASPPKKRTGLYLGIAAVLVIGGIAIATAGGGDGGTAGNAPVQPSPEEAAYIGRLLPASYEATTVAEPATYDSVVEMTEVPATTGDTQVTIPLADVVNAKLSLSQYEPAGAPKPLPLIAYVKPSGELFVGISFCPPCQGEWQTIQPDGTLTCNSCGTKRDLETQAGISGTCKLYPLDELPVTIVDGNITIDRAVLDSWTPQPLDRKVG